MKKKFIFGVGILLLAFICYYIMLPAINVHSPGFWIFIMAAVLLLLLFYAVNKGIKLDSIQSLKSNFIVKVGFILLAALVLFFIGGSLLSSPILNAKKYQQLMTVKEREFTEDIEEISYNQIPLLDKDSAILLGNRKMGTMIDMVSQFEVSDLYTQINVNGEPVRVTPLVYASTFKWLTNQSEGIPAYIKIDMATQNTELVKLTQSIRYSESELFNRNIYRHLRYNYPTYIFDDISFEIDDDGIPYWICPVIKYNIGLFGGVTIGRVVVCNASTGETVDYAIEDCPIWVDRVYSADMLISLYDYYGTLKHGFINSVLGQKDCLETTDGYNYIALEDDVWVYTGITSVSGDESNVGFVLMNQRTMETRFYSITGAEEYSAMASAEGQVQHLGYTATFPLLLNIANEPTYFLALKDDAGLVKTYAMVNVEKYQSVAIGDTIVDCEQAYIVLLKKEGIQVEEEGNVLTVSGEITKIAQGVVDGNSHYYLMLKGNDSIFDVSVTEWIDIIRYDEGDLINIHYVEDEGINTVVSIE